jgi:NTP pyrophosphatase (non-canonical NTP hydrolase)
VKELQALAAKLQRDLAANRRDAMNDDNALDIQALCVAEEAGEVVGAYRRYSGKARRSGTLQEVADEIADVLIVTAIFAVMLHIDINDAVQWKLRKIYSRGWMEVKKPYGDEYLKNTGQQ